MMTGSLHRLVPVTHWRGKISIRRSPNFVTPELNLLRDQRKQRCAIPQSFRIRGQSARNSQTQSELTIMKATKIAFTGIPVTDMKRACDFYEGVLGLKPSEDFSEGVWIEYEIGPGTIAIGSVGDQWKPSPDGTSVAIEVEDFDAAIKSLREKKARILDDNVESPVCRMAIVQDPDGNKT